MPKLKDGEKVKQEFLVTVKFTAVEGDTKFKAFNLRETLEVGNPGTKFVVKEVKNPA